MRRLIVSLILVGAFVAPAGAQAPATASSRLAWDQAAPTLAEANAYTYRYYPDGATAGIAFAAGSVTCSGTASPFVCIVNFPAFTPGNHTLTLTAANVAGESAPSVVLTFQMVVTPAVPANPRIQ